MQKAIRNILVFTTFVLTFPVIAGAQVNVAEQNPRSFLRQLQKRDSILIADQLVYGFRIDGVPEGASIECPDFDKNFTEGVTVIADWKLDTIKVHRGGRGNPAKYDIEGGVVITSFTEGEYALDTIKVMLGKNGAKPDTLVFDPSRLEVKTMPVDTATFEPHDIKEQIRYPITFAEVLPWLLGISALIMLVIGVYYMIRYYRRKNNPEFAKKEPAHIIALRRLDKYRGDKMWAPEKQKAFYSGITDALREYISSRYGIGAMEMTTAEIFKDMKQTDAPESLVNEVRVLFERADYVKFAKYVATEEENASALPLAVRFVTETYQAEIEAESANDK